MDQNKPIDIKLTIPQLESLKDALALSMRHADHDDDYYDWKTLWCIIQNKLAMTKGEELSERLANMIAHV